MRISLFSFKMKLTFSRRALFVWLLLTVTELHAAGGVSLRADSRFELFSEPSRFNPGDGEVQMKKSSYCVEIRLFPISSAILPRPDERSNGALNDDPSGVIGLQISGCTVEQYTYQLFVRL